MIQYITTKIVSAWPEARQDQPGYGVGYADGYISWCPKEQFEATAVGIGKIGHLTPGQQNHAGELRLLDERIEDLSTILTDSEATQDMSEEVFERLRMQLEAMEIYSHCLRETEKAFPDAPHE